MAGIRRDAGEFGVGSARSFLARVTVRASILVVAGGVVFLGSVLTGMRLQIAMRIFALVRSPCAIRIGFTFAGVCTWFTNSTLAGVRIAAHVSILAWRIVRLGWIGASSVRGVADADVMALIGSAAFYGAPAGARSCDTSIV